MPVFEFVVEGPAVSIRAKTKNAKRYRKWIQDVRIAAQKQWPPGNKPIGSKVEATISVYCTEAPPDIDNIIKPILDALCKLVYNDDQQVYRVTSQRFALPMVERSSEHSTLLADALQEHSEVLHVVVTWEDEG
jgi:hypothetical protein